MSLWIVLFSFVVSLGASPLVFPMLRKLKFGQFVRDDGPATHLQKAGTLTMGGVLFLPGFLLSSLLFMEDGAKVLPVLLVVAGYGLVGFWDDYVKVVKKRSLGLSAYQKILAQLVVTGLFIAYAMESSQASTSILLPFLPGRALDLGWWYVPFTLVVVLGTVNGVNLTDGLDGLAGTVTLIVSGFFLVAALLQGNPLAVPAAAMAGSLLVFLIFNSHPAKVFMGDVGSLALGGFVAAMAVSMRMPLWIVLVGGVYLVESLSVMIQVAWFKKTGKRVFKMAPLHHHYELKGHKETKIVAVFGIVTLLLGIVGILAMG
ncbi:phospho-N-acetylmuramoyl-pentapeptide-transferase [Anaerotalea alkaliphila]|uniref:Phospho-N-acetylmuramoyl-pentapeptide-transferase n=1 Tax=Anaerotalea alkaliphila TaxID=2662126 RepID=A0A7X5HT17_9FIRM|nr:phospho-N-acetylmuramoyl-pentapeptide-transferase [Anaerotalea alkaliphila]